MTDHSKPENRHPPRPGGFTQGLLHTGSILSALDIKPGQNVLDAGCGNGYMSKLFAKQVGSSGKVYALDNNSHYVETLGRETLGGNIQAIAADITRPTGLADSSIDLIYISTVIHIFSRQQMRGFLQESQRLLKPKAKLAIVEIEKKDTPFGPPLESRYSPQELIKIVPMKAFKTMQAGEHFYMQIFLNQ